MPIPSEKGNSLEQAVAAIERHILATAPGLNEGSFLIESKKVLVIGGVRHEIDIFVTIDSGPGYKSVFIFECKNWEDAVGKNEIIVFSEKIDAIPAQYGYFVAKSFTKDAEAQAKKDLRITLLIATEHDPLGIPTPFDFHFIQPVIKQVEVMFKGKSGSGEPVELNVDSTTAELNGSTLNLKEYVNIWASQLANEDVRRFPSRQLPDGNYERSAETSREFERGDFVIDGTAILETTLRITYAVQVINAAVLSSFEVATRGRVLSLAPVQMGGASVSVSFVSKSQ